MGGARRQDAEAALACEPIPLLPERGLADSRIALEQQCLPAGGHSPQKPIERQQFLGPADDLAYHRTLFPRAITPDSASRAQITSGQSADEADNRRPPNSGPARQEPQEKPRTVVGRLGHTAP